MGKENQRFKIGEEYLTEEQIPKSFEPYNVFLDFREVFNHAKSDQEKNKIKDIFQRLLIVHLTSLIQEIKRFPNTLEYEYAIEIDDKGQISLHDYNYALQSDQLVLATSGWLDAEAIHIQPSAKSSINVTDFFRKLRESGVQDPRNVNGLLDLFLVEYGNAVKHVDHSKKGKIFIERYLLETWQLYLLIHEHIATDPLFAHPVLNNLAVTHGRTYATVMNKTAAHQGEQSFNNFYFLQYDQERGYSLKKMGWYNWLDDKDQVKLLEKLGQEGVVADELSLMTTIAQLDDSWSKDPIQLLIELAKSSGDKKIQNRIRKQEKRFQKQKRFIEESAEVFVDAFIDEMERENKSEREIRDDLDALAEAVLNPLLLNRRFPVKKVLEQFRKIKLKGGGRDKFLGSLVFAIPSLLVKVGGWSLCGGLSAGGINIGPNQANGYGGFNSPDNCMRCPKCQEISTDGNTCSHCGNKRPSSPLTFLNNLVKPLKNSSSKRQNNSKKNLISSKPEKSKSWLNMVLPDGNNSVGLGKAMEFGPKKSISVTEALSFRLGQ